MNKQMYDLIKTAMQEGKSIDEVINEVNDLAQTAEKEMEMKNHPKTPIKDKYLDMKEPTLYTIQGTIYKPSLVSLIARYMIEQGFEPDVCFQFDEEFRANIIDALDSCINCALSAQKLTKMEQDGASEEEILKASFAEIKNMMKNLGKGHSSEKDGNADIFSFLFS